MAKEVASADDVLGSLKNSKLELGSFVQRAGLYLAAGVGTLIAVTTIALIAFLYIYYPTPLSTESLKGTDEATKTLMTNHRELGDAAVKNAKELFQTIVAQAFLPVFTAVLGYIFGKSERKE